MNFLLNTIKVIPQADVSPSLRLFEGRNARVRGDEARCGRHGRSLTVSLFGDIVVATVTACFPRAQRTEASLPGAEIL